MRACVKIKVIILMIFLISYSVNHIKSSQGQSDIMVASINWDLILHNFKIEPNSSIDIDCFGKHYELYPERWKMVFDYLNSLKTDSLLLGTINLSSDVCVTVSEHQTKREEEILSGSHREYIDLQYVIEDSEYIGLSHNATENIVLYNEERDITFYKVDIEKYLRADSTRFLLFFPKDLHQSCMNTGRDKKAKKVVIKIRAN